ncbi:hypothetical protein J2X16_000795 [Pelomonas aquatica]|uniref:Uncharacterized protein n=1 Tax=Pelomonas aquatica TaxID=431058 RepID=A0ABU1Z4D1_9BURK|nr:DUF6731 family protein [Pelomonas aquatica]MDR7295474.1 hypothetical protein [Pelomonas aquatica]
MTTVKTHLFDFVSPSDRDLTAMLRRLRHTPKGNRWRSVFNHDMALLELQERNGVWLMDFVKRREVGPGKVRQNSDMEPFQFQNGETYGEETAALWDPQRRWMAVQFNQHGVRGGSIANYLNDYDADPHSDWVLAAKLDAEAANALRRRPLLRKARLKFTVNQHLTQSMRESGTALGAAMSQVGEQSGTATVDIELNMSHDAGFLDGTVGRFLRWVGNHADESDGLRAMQIKGREEVDGEDKIIDLLHQRIKGDFDSRELQVESGRYTVQSRWNMLLRQHAGWCAEYGG